MNTLYNYVTLQILQHSGYAVKFMWIRDGTASLVVMISFWEWFDTLTLQPGVRVDRVGIPRNVGSRFEQHVSGWRTREGKLHILPFIENFEQSSGPRRVRWPQAREDQYRQHRHGSVWRQQEAPWLKTVDRQRLDGLYMPTLFWFVLFCFVNMAAMVCTVAISMLFKPHWEWSYCILDLMPCSLVHRWWSLGGRNLIPASSALERVAARSSKLYYPSSKLHGITLRKTIISITTSIKNLTCHAFIMQ